MIWADYLNDVVFQDKNWRITKHLNYGAKEPYYCLCKKGWFFWHMESWGSNRSKLEDIIKRDQQYKDGTYPAVQEFEEPKNYLTW
jgi:hypothetical protein